MEKLKKNQTYDRIRSAIESGQYPRGSRLPAEPEFCRQLGVSRVTLRSALSRLAKEGLIVRTPRNGTMVLPEPRKLLFVNANPGSMEEYNSCLHILPGVDQACRQHGLGMDLFDLPLIQANGIQALAEKISQKYMGIIVVTSSFLGHEPILDLIRSTGLPAVLAHAQEEDHKITGLPVIATNVREAFADGLRHLACFGHRQVATVWLNFPYRRGHNKEEYAALLDSLGMNSDPKLMINLPSCNEKDAFETVQTFFRQQKVQPTALMCYSDYIAMLCYPALQALGLRIPEDVAIMGYCGLPGRTLLTPPLSTVDVGYARIGTMAVELILRADEWFRPEGGNAPLIYSPHVVDCRQSTDQIVWQNLQ
jgi:DNA-binding LacI/PurR family transcriptional regulator